MKWSWNLGRIAGVRVNLHLTFLFLLAFVGLRGLWSGFGLAGAAFEVAFIVAVFGSVLLHELGHALTARKFGIGTRSITLLPIGGVAALESEPRSSSEELWIALAGPAVNFAIAAGLYVLATFTGGLAAVGEVFAIQHSFVTSLMWANLLLGAFNLLPAFPMDGGRVLRALLARRKGYLQATLSAAFLGKAFAFAFGIIGLFTSPVLLLVALFLWFAASSEGRRAEHLLERQQARVHPGFDTGWPFPARDVSAGPVPRFEELRQAEQVRRGRVPVVVWVNRG